MYVDMTRVISISDEAYNALKKLKDDKSFSEVIIEITMKRKKDDIMKFAGILSDKEGEAMKKRIYEERKLKSRRFS